MAKFHQGKFTPKSPQKYKGDHTNIIYRSSWELRFLKWCDMNPSIIEYSSEETIIPYVCPTDGRAHRYFVDVKMKVKDREGKEKTYLIEIKPSHQTLPPAFPGRRTTRYLNEVKTFAKNQAKFQAARDYCKDRNWEFKIITERELGINGKSNKNI